MSPLENLTLETATPSELTQALFTIVTELENRLAKGETTLAFRVVIKDKAK
jgi:hypothetical protein